MNDYQAVGSQHEICQQDALLITSHAMDGGISCQESIER